MERSGMKNLLVLRFFAALRMTVRHCRQPGKSFYLKSVIDVFL